MTGNKNRSPVNSGRQLGWKPGLRVSERKVREGKEREGDDRKGTK